MSRRTFLGAAGGIATGATLAGADAGTAAGAAPGSPDALSDRSEPFYGTHQGGITTSPQRHAQFAALVAAALATGRSAPGTTDPAGGRLDDSGETVGLGPARLTINFGLGPSLFGLGGTDRFGLRAAWPTPLVELPPFDGDRLTPATSGGDLTAHACSDDPQVAFHTLRQLLRVSAGVAAVRWSQAGFNEQAASSGTPRDLLGFKDGTINPRTDMQLDNFVWVGGEGPDWMSGGTYVVTRRIRVDLDRWDDLSLEDQERVIGRHKVSGAPLGKARESDALDLATTSGSGRPVIGANAHVRLAAPEENWGQMLSGLRVAGPKVQRPTGVSELAAPARSCGHAEEVGVDTPPREWRRHAVRQDERGPLRGTEAGASRVARCVVGNEEINRVALAVDQDRAQVSHLGRGHLVGGTVRAGRLSARARRPAARRKRHRGKDQRGAPPQSAAGAARPAQPATARLRCNDEPRAPRMVAAV